jgi:hypothetical protein
MRKYLSAPTCARTTVTSTVLWTRYYGLFGLRETVSLMKAAHRRIGIGPLCEQSPSTYNKYLSLFVFLYWEEYIIWASTQADLVEPTKAWDPAYIQHLLVQHLACTTACLTLLMLECTTHLYQQSASTGTATLFAPITSPVFQKVTQSFGENEA